MRQRAIRALMAETGLTYTQAARKLDRRCSSVAERSLHSSRYASRSRAGFPVVNPALEMIREMATVQVSNPALEMIREMATVQVSNPALEAIREMVARSQKMYG